MSALEIRDEYLKNKAADVVLVKGVHRIPIEYDSLLNIKGEIIRITKERFAQTYTWIEWEKSNNRFTVWPDTAHELGKLNMYADDYFRNNIWIWDKKPHWAYNTEFMILVEDRNAIEWTPNTIKADVKIEGDVASISLSSNTPNLKAYQIKESPVGEWMDISNPVMMTLKKDKNELAFRSLNLTGIPGTEYKVIIGR